MLHTSRSGALAATAAAEAHTAVPPSQRLRQPTRGRLLLVDDDPHALRGMARLLRAHGFEVSTATNGHDAARLVVEQSFDVILSDIAMPGMDGIQLLREVRTHDLRVPVVLITGEPAVSTAIQALEYGAFHYLTKPVRYEDITSVADKALRMHRMARVEQEAAEFLGTGSLKATDRAGLEASFQRALDTLWMAYHPIVHAGRQSVFGHEALLRSNEPALPHPGAVIEAAEKLECLDTLGRTIRDRAAEPIAAGGPGVLFVNLHTRDLLDPTLTSTESPLSKIARRVVLEITERASLDSVKDVRSRVAALREMGFRIAVDDLGAGYAGLTSFALLEPEIVKLDMTLVRDVHVNSTKQKLIRSMTSLSKDMGMMVVGEGVETQDECDALVDLGCDLLQGFLFARPGRAFPEVKWPSAR